MKKCKMKCKECKMKCECEDLGRVVSTDVCTRCYNMSDKPEQWEKDEAWRAMKIQSSRIYEALTHKSW